METILTNVSTIGKDCDYATLTLWADAKEGDYEMFGEIAECIDNSDLPTVTLDQSIKDRKWIGIHVDRTLEGKSWDGR